MHENGSVRFAERFVTEQVWMEPILSGIEIKQGRDLEKEAKELANHGRCT